MLPQEEADLLMEMEKKFVFSSTISVAPGTDQSFKLVALHEEEEFIFDVSRSEYRLSKVTYQARTKKVIPLVRLDIDGSPHKNPPLWGDEDVIRGSHVHIYREGYGTKVAYPLDHIDVQSPKNVVLTFKDFCSCRYCNIKEIPPLQGEIL